ncbi:AraC family transcriptional regulator [Butyrivibrio sp. MC2013]|uniref:AraC family transcriptional regulator n=1 Tax=Butyrivibrio sp. MC2013 TaxID=1280686 RepID=UPI00041ED86F|nr:helix-turn-helix domain-containing protein [Butyrivibrio sp. MC2013]
MQILTNEYQLELSSKNDYSFPVDTNLDTILDYENGKFLWHWHPEIELTLIVSGEMEYRVNEHVYILKEGEGLFANSNALHAGFQNGENNCYYFRIKFHPRFLYGYEGSILQTKYVDFIIKNDSWDSIKLDPNMQRHAEILDKIKEIHRLSQQPPTDYELRIQLLCMQIWQILYDYYSSLPGDNMRVNRHIDRLRNILIYIQENFDQPISIVDVAGSVNICKEECCRFFKKYMNTTIIEYQMSLRIQNSLSLLRRGESITHIAGEMGFNSPAYYTKIFKRYMKCTPKEYAKKTKPRESYQ